MSRKVIFLDIDDCVSNDRSILACRSFDESAAYGYLIPRTGDGVAIGLINRACALCHAKVVISSTWVAVVGPGYTLDWLTMNGLQKAHLFTPDPCVTYRPRGTKFEAINDWCVRNAEVATGDIAVIDDDVTLFPSGHPLAQGHVVIEGEDGILLRHYREIVAKLGGTDREARTD